MKQFITGLKSLSKKEKTLWVLSCLVIVVSWLLANHGSLLVLCASLIGVTSLIFDAKGDPFGQFLMIVFSLLYGIISWFQNYYGEMITYLGMTLPMAVLALIEWQKNPFEEGKSEVRVEKLSSKEWMTMVVLTLLTTGVFYFILKWLHTSSLPLSTVSIATSFIAAYLTWKRSEWYAVGYAANDIVLILLWLMAARQDPGCLSMVVCFCVFLVNDLYRFFSWKAMGKKQALAFEER